MLRSFLAALAAVLPIAAVLPLPVCAQGPAGGSPSKPIKVMVITVAGSTTDVVARTLGERMSQALGQPWLVENRPGASGMIAAEMVARAEPDGHTLLFATSAVVSYPALYPKMKFDIAKDIAPVGWIASSPNVLLINPERGVKTLGELIELARRTPGGIDYGSPLVGSTAHLLVEIFRRAAGIPMTHVPFKGAQQAISEAMADRVPVTMVGVSNAVAPVRGGRLTPLAVADSKRSAVFPTVPTFSELGHADVDLTFWMALWAPAGTPAPAIDRLNRDLNASLKAREVVERFAQLGFEPVGGTPQRLADLMRRETPLYAKIIAAVGIKVE